MVAAYPLPIPSPVRHKHAASWLILLMALSVAALGSRYLIASSLGQHAVLALGFFGILFGLMLYTPLQGVQAALIYLALLGGLRRWLIPALGWTPLDVMVLVSPVLVFLYAADLWRKHRIARGTRLSRLLVFLLAVMVFQILNPVQGGLTVGLGGAIFYIVPLLWFYVGNALGPGLLRGMFRVTVGLSLLAAVYGLCQTFFGLLPVEQEWVRLAGYTSLMLDDNVVRAFAFFTSSEEYSQFLSIGLVLLWAAFLKGHRQALLPIPLLGLALFLESGRGNVVMALAICVLLWAVQGATVRSWIPRGVLALALASCGLIWSLHEVQQRSYDDRVQAAVQHQTEGLLDPLNAQHSTATTHYSMFTYGFTSGLSHPLGKGLGATTLAGSKFGDTGGNMEVDLSNLFVSLGLVGGILYAAVLGIVTLMAFHYWQRDRSLEALRTLALLAVVFGHWLDGGYYATAMLVWVCIGAMHRAETEAASPNAAPEGMVSQKPVRGAAL